MGILSEDDHAMIMQSLESGVPLEDEVEGDAVESGADAVESSEPAEDVKEDAEAVAEEAQVEVADPGVPSHIPYSRFKEVNDHRRAEAERAQALERELAEMRGKLSVLDRQGPAARAREETEAEEYINELLSVGVSDDAVEKLVGLSGKVQAIDHRLDELLMAGQVKQQLDNVLTTVRNEYPEVSEEEVLVAIRDSGGAIDPIMFARQTASTRRVESKDAEIADLREQLSKLSGKAETIVRPGGRGSEDVAPDAPAGEPEITTLQGAKSAALRLLNSL